MNTIGAINELKRLVNETLDESRLGLVFSDEEYEDELRHVYEEKTKSIQNNLNRVLDRCPKEHCEATLERFLGNMKKVQDGLSELEKSVRVTSAILQDNLSSRKAIQMDFCRKVISFIETTSSQIEKTSKEALTIDEGIDTYYRVIKKEVKDNLPLIYHNLVDNNWIDGNDTSLGDFNHYFGGAGIKPRHRIKWNKSLAVLAAFIDLMADDNNPIAKAAEIFSICDDKDKDYHAVSKDSLKQRRYKALTEGDAPFFTYQKTIKKEIFGLTE